MRKTILNLTAIAAITSIVFIACQDSAASEEKSIAMTKKEMVKRGAISLTQLDVMIVIHQKKWGRTEPK